MPTSTKIPIFVVMSEPEVLQELVVENNIRFQLFLFLYYFYWGFDGSFLNDLINCLSDLNFLPPKGETFVSRPAKQF